MFLVLGLEHSCPWPRECLSSERLSLALASDFFCVLGLGLEPCVLDSTSGHLAKQNVAFRGHDETSSSKDKGNFLEEIYFLSKYHQPLKDWIDKHPQNVSYLSHVSQNEMLAICSSLTANAICDEVHTAKYFSIECDEVTSHKKAFMSIILRYVSNFQIHERCFKLVPVTSYWAVFS